MNVSDFIEGPPASHSLTMCLSGTRQKGYTRLNLTLVYCIVNEPGTPDGVLLTINDVHTTRPGTNRGSFKSSLSLMEAVTSGDLHAELSLPRYNGSNRILCVWLCLWSFVMRGKRKKPAVGGKDCPIQPTTLPCHVKVMNMCLVCSGSCGNLWMWGVHIKLFVTMCLIVCFCVSSSLYIDGLLVLHRDPVSEID